ncbi:transposase family protein [Salinicoccus sp. YB14-2]|uniref:transposase family protein n=1 Tax=Salinicoccus sp. YB14-2 TaxID=1572701 RepID=UPI000A69BFD9|nr:transposase family protein [Salinicoccus sp. YB14-2]
MNNSVINPIAYLDGNAQVIYKVQSEKEIFLIIKIDSQSATCPSCHSGSSHRHSRYCRNVQDLPVSECYFHFQIIVQKWFCDNPDCQKKVFTERLSWLAPYQRKTARLERVIEKIAFSTNCLTAEKVCESLHIRISHDTLLRRVKNVSFNHQASPFCRYR